MNSETKKLQVARWTDDPAQQEEFFAEVNPTIKQESRYWCGSYRVGMDREDIESDIRVRLMEQMRKGDGPFAKDSPKEAAACYKADYKIRNNAQWLARKERERPSRQAQILAKVGPPDVSRDLAADLLDIARRVGIFTEMSNFTPRERDIFRKESLRRIGIDDLDVPLFDQAAQAAGISGSELRAYIENHDEEGHSSASDRKAWSRAHPKFLEAFTRAKLASLLVSLSVMVFVLSLALCGAIRQGRSTHQNHFANQGSFISQDALARQDNLIEEDTRAHQDD